jgi:Arc/MetJ-type ribon-helix-helix transcriptional regulator
MVVNVGIKEEQKEKINSLIQQNKEKYPSINDFVQKGVELLINKEVERMETGLEGVEKSIDEIDVFLGKMLEGELEDKITITNEIAEDINEALNDLKIFKAKLGYENKSRVLILAIGIKDILNELDIDLKREFKDPKSKIPQEYITNLKKLKEDFISSVKKIER